MLKTLTTLISVVLLVGCSDRAKPSTSYREYRHPNGIAIKAPRSTTVEQTTTGFELREIASINGRYPKEATVSAMQQSQHLMLNKHKKVDDRSVSYQIEETGSGSGGTVYRLRVLLELGGVTLLFEEYEQSEWTPPTFELCWALLGTTTIK